MDWPLSCYGLNLSWNGGDNIIKGDFSPEELRCEAYFQVRSLGNIDEYKRTLELAFREKKAIVHDIVTHPSKGVAMGRTPRNSCMQDLLRSRSNTDCNLKEFSQISEHQALSQTPRTSVQLTDDFDFGDIPEILPG